MLNCIGGVTVLDFKKYTFWFVTGSQHLYGPETLEMVAADSKAISEGLDKNPAIPCRVIFKPVLTTPDAIRKLCLEANSDDSCAGIITWMHTFSPAKMWIAGLSVLNKPLLHLHTQFNRDIPWDSIDMDFMNLNQSAHGDREYGFIGSRMRIARKVIVGHWQDEATCSRIGSWMRTAVAVEAGRSLKVARFGDNMREVAVTEGDKVEAQIKFGWSINGYGIGDLVARISNVSDSEADRLVQEYGELYEIPAEVRSSSEAMEAIKEQARIEIGLRSFLAEGGFGAFTTTFEDLHGMKQLPGLAVQRLMADGYGFGAEGDWKTAAMVRMVKIMTEGLPGGTTFMEDYTYHLAPGNEMILGAHMLEVCPTVAGTKPRIEVHPLSRIRRSSRQGSSCFAYRHGQPLQADHQRSGCCKSGKRHAETPGRKAAVETPAVAESRGRGMDPGRRRPPYGLLLRSHCRTAYGLGGNGRHRIRANKREHQYPELQERTQVERDSVQYEINDVCRFRHTDAENSTKTNQRLAKSMPF